MIRIFLSVMLVFIAFSACHSSKMSAEKNKQVTQRIINAKIAIATSGHRPIVVDSELKYRRQYIRYGLFDDADLVYKHLKTPAWDNLQFKIVLPDTLTKRVRMESFKRELLDSAAVYLAFSPLLPLKEKNCYLIQEYTTGYIEEDVVKVTWTNRQFVKYRIQKNKIEVLDNWMGFEGPYDVD